MVSRYFGVVFVVISVAISDNAEGSSNTSLSASPTISMNSSAISNTSMASSPVIASSPIVFTSSAKQSFTSPIPTSTSSVIPSVSPTPTSTPTKPPTKKPNPHGKPTKGRSFDAASFFGGIILGVIVVIACFVGYTWWQNKRKSYHSL